MLILPGRGIYKEKFDQENCLFREGVVSVYVQLKLAHTHRNWNGSEGQDLSEREYHAVHSD